jgi:hypothetical protein
MKKRVLTTTFVLGALIGLPLAISYGLSRAQSDKCPLLLPPAGSVVNVHTVAQLQEAVNNLTSNTTILIADGVFALTNTLVIDGVDNVALRGASGDRDAVILRGRGMSNANYGNVPHGILIQNATDVLIADLTIRDFYYHAVQIQGERGAQRPQLYNVHLIDIGEQFVKVSTTGPPGPYADDGIVECSLIEYTNRARSDYTNGVDVLAGARWIVRDNVFRRIRAPVGQLAGPAVLMWRNSLDSIVERNQFIECDRGIALGLTWPDPGLARDGETVYDHQGGVVRNNFIYRAGDGDIGITVNCARDFKIYHNTVILNGTFPWGAIEYRFPPSNGRIRYNLSDAPIWQRDGATANLVGNITNAETGWFVDAASGDLHLVGTATAAIGQAAPLAEVPDDFDGDARPIGGAPDVGADEYGVPAPAAVTDLRVVNAVTAGGTLTVTLGWSPPEDAFTTTLRYSDAFITEASWDSATLLSDTLPSSAETFTAAVPYGGDTVYFALKSQNSEGSWSTLSNNAFWPYFDLCLPLILREHTRQ